VRSRLKWVGHVERTADGTLAESRYQESGRNMKWWKRRLRWENYIKRDLEIVGEGCRTKAIAKMN